MHIDDINFRPATKQDCRDIARLYSISSDGVADYIWTQQAEPGEDIIDVGTRRYEREDSLFSYINCTIAEIGGTVAGMLVAFPMRVDKNAEPETDPVLAPFSKLEQDNSYYVCDVGLFEQYRGIGIGTRFMELAESGAKKLGLNKISLIVFEQNQGAMRLYKRIGYKEAARERVNPHPLIHFEGDAVLMVKKLS